MKVRAVILNIAIWFFTIDAYAQSSGHDIIFCGESIPVSDRFVADKLMNIIRRQINYVNMPDLRNRTRQYFGIVEACLRASGLPEDFKYLAIVESGFTNAVSKAGAAGFWQIMPGTAKDWGLVINAYVDERNDIYKSTHAACQELARNYLYIKRRYGISSWVLAAAAYNHGVGNMVNAIKQQGNNYFQMNLNPETATYVYKIIAVKELFEYPELYMKNFGYNVFNAASRVPSGQDGTSDAAPFSSMTVKVDDKDGNHPANIDTAIAMFDRNNIQKYIFAANTIFGTVTFVSAKIVGRYRDFKDGDLVSFELQSDLKVHNSFVGKGTIIQWQGWKIDDRIYIDLGYGHNVILYDMKSNHGLSLSSLKKKEVVTLMVNNVD